MQADGGLAAQHSPVSVIVPAHNEEAGIGRLLDALTAGANDEDLEVLVVCNGCTDLTAEIARSYPPLVRVIELPEASKRKAQLEGEKAARGYPRAYVDADVVITHGDLRRLAAQLREGILATAPKRRLDLMRASRIVRRYYTVWQRLPQTQEGLFGRGVVVVSAQGAGRLPSTPDLLSDDLAMSESFTPAERLVVDDATVTIIAPRATRDLIRRRTRVEIGNRQLAEMNLRRTRSKTSLATLGSILMAEPGLAPDLVVFVGVTVIARVASFLRLRSGKPLGWDRDESSRAPIAPDQGEMGDKGLGRGSEKPFSEAVVLAAVNPWSGVRLADRQLAEALASYLPVLYVEPQWSIVTRFRKSRGSGLSAGGRITRIGDNLAVLSPDALPGLSRRAVAGLNRRLKAWQVRRALQQLDGSASAVIEADILSPVMADCDEKVSIYWAQDDFVGMAPLVGADPKRFASAEKEVIARADSIVAANPSVAASLRAPGRKVHLIPYGCDIELFRSATTAVPAEDVTLVGPAAVFMGHLGDRIDLDVLDAVAESGVPLLLVGPAHYRSDMGRFRSLLSRANVQWTRGREFEALPRYLAHGAVGLLPYNHSAFNLGSFPLKTLEYLAAGLPVIATPLPAIDWLATEHIVVRNTPLSFAAAVEDAVRQGRSPEADARRQAFAATHSWHHRAQDFLNVLDLAGPPHIGTREAQETGA